jgi:hypothetical protein
MEKKSNGVGGRNTASKTPGPDSVCQPSMPQLNLSQASKMP